MPSDAPLGVLGVLLVSAVGGAGTMVVELAAVRLLAPWFGSSQAVWTNVIAVVLLALALGYLIGGQLSGRGKPLATMGLVLFLAGLWTACLPWLASWAAGLFLPERIALQDAADVVLWGSLATSLLLFLPPAAVLGCVSPLAVEVVQRAQGGRAGRAGGLVLCSGTLGSLLGVFGTSHVLLANLGLGGTFRVAALALILAGALASFLARSKRSALTSALVLVGWGASLALGDAARPALREGQTQLAYGESDYQSVRIVEELALGMRFLQVNEGFDSFQSVWRSEPGLLESGYYYNDFSLPALWQEKPGPWRLMVLGLGAGTALRVMEGVLPEGTWLKSLGIELDPLVVELAREHMDLADDDANLRVHGGLDARVALSHAEGSFDQIILDCYANQVEIPPHLCTLEFFRELKQKLAPGGWLSVNLGGFGFEDPVVAAVAKTCAQAFGDSVLLMRVPRSRNFSLVARRDAALPLDANGQLMAGTEPSPQLIAPRLLPGAWQLVAPGAEGRLLTDDDCPMEYLQSQSIRDGARLMAAGTHG